MTQEIPRRSSQGEYMAELHSSSTNHSEAASERSRSRSSLTRHASHPNSTNPSTPVEDSTQSTQTTLRVDSRRLTLDDILPKKKPKKRPPPLTIHTNQSFWDNMQIEGLDRFNEAQESSSTEDVTPDTPTSLGIPGPPLQQSRTQSPDDDQIIQKPVSPAISVPPPDPPPPDWSTIHEYAFIFNVCFAQFMALAALAQTVAPLSIIGEDMQVDHPGQLSWFTAAYSMSLGAFILPAGRIGDMYGHKNIFLLGWLWFALFSFMAGFGHSWGPIAFSVARGFQGIGPALLVPNAMALIGRTFPIGTKRNIVFSVFGACGPTGFLVGAAMSSLLSEKTWWPWTFWTSALVSLFTTAISFFVIPKSMAKAPAPPGTLIPSFDFLGALTGISGLIFINFSLNQAPLVGWKTPYVYYLLLIGVMLTFAFVYVELQWVRCPLVPIRGLQPQAVMALACICAGWASHGIWIYYFFKFLERLRNESPLLATLHLVPVAPMGIAWALSTNFLIKKFHVSKLMLLSMIFFFVGMVLLAFAPQDQSYWLQIFLSVIIMPGGMNLSFPAGTILLSNAMPREHQGKAASLISTVVNYSIASGLGFAGSVERSINYDGTRTLEGYRGACYLGMGFSGVGVLISIYFVWRSRKC